MPNDIEQAADRVWVRCARVIRVQRHRNGAGKLGRGKGFVLAAGGDCIISTPVSRVRAFAPLKRLLSSADVATVNLENSLLDLSQSLVPLISDEYGSSCLIGSAAVAADLKAIGINMLSRANNHSVDFGADGMAQTSRLLDEAGLLYSGVGDNLLSARAPCFLDGEKKRAALISVTSTFTPWSRATHVCDRVAGRPGVNTLRTTRYCHVSSSELRVIRRIRDEQPAGSVPPAFADDLGQVHLWGTAYKAADHRGFSYAVHTIDEQDILKVVRTAKASADFVVVSMHSHEPGNWSEQPADFLPGFARAVLDSGADAFVAHGPHRLRGIEVYHGRPVFYSLGNFIYQIHSIPPMLNAVFEQYKTDLGLSDLDFTSLVKALTAGHDEWYQSILTLTRFGHGRARQITIIPLDLRQCAQGADHGVPRCARGHAARSILHRVKRLSEPFGTELSIVGDVGIIRLSDNL